MLSRPIRGEFLREAIFSPLLPSQVLPGRIGSGKMRELQVSPVK
jgi:hypothetical protein